MSKYTDKLQEWVDSVKMCEAAGIEPCYKLDGLVFSLSVPHFVTNKKGGSPSIYQFPIAIIDGNPVFVGDELWLNGVKIVVMSARQENGTRLLNEWCVHHWSWNPPKPKTVMVEMLVEDAELLVMPDEIGRPDWHNRLSRACRKALAEQNG